MTYPNTPEEKARQLGARFACEAFNACGSLDAKKCQEMGDAFGKAIAELVRSVSWEAAAEKWLKTWPGAEDFYRTQVYPPLFPKDLFGTWRPPPLEIPTSLSTFADMAAGPARSARAPLPEPAYMRCFVCGKHRGEACGHDTDNGSERRWYCSRECFDQ
jgi:hypothetical protein